MHFRDVADTRGTHIGCDTGHCGACTVLLDGKHPARLDWFAVQADDDEILTLEGLAMRGYLSIEQEAFRSNFATQCGYCTSGMLIMTYYLIRKLPSLSRDEIGDRLHGNYCICTGYEQIVNAIDEAHRRYRESGQFEISG